MELERSIEEYIVLASKAVALLDAIDKVVNITDSHFTDSSRVNLISKITEVNDEDSY